MDFETEQRVLDLESKVDQLSDRVTELESELRGAREWAAEQRERAE
jgi:outer membrane murein-binding lipoprotein Lpp